MLEKVKSLLEPGGILGIIDHAGKPGQDNAELHRIDKNKVIDAARQAGFEVVAESPRTAT